MVRKVNEHTQTMLEFAAIVTPLFLACFGGILAIYSRLARLETKVDPVWKWWTARINGGSRQEAD
jgi:hypothetical protein